MSFGHPVSIIFFLDSRVGVSVLSALSKDQKSLVHGFLEFLDQRKDLS